MELNQDYLNKHFHGKRVCIKPQAYVEHNHFASLPDKEYIITACLLNERFLDISLMAIDYSPENRQWYRLPLCLGCASNLDEVFEIKGNYHPITYEALCVIEAVENNLPLTKKVLTTSETDEILPVPFDTNKSFNIGDAVYYVKWTTTWGAQLERVFVFTGKDYRIKEDFDILANQGIRNIHWWVYWGHTTTPNPPGF